MLVRTPAPNLRESLVGYLVRLAEENGYDSPATILNYADCPPGAIPSGKANLTKLANVTGHALDEFSKISYDGKLPGKSPGSSVNGHLISSWRSARVLSPRRISVCHQCVDEQEGIDSFWDLTLAVVCPKHGCRSIRACRHCERPITWARPGVLICSCGKSLSDSAQGRATDTEIELSKMLRAKFVGDSLAELKLRGRYPVSELEAMTFVQFASLLFNMGQSFGRLTYSQALKSPDVVLSEAAKSLQNWPIGFRRSLKKLATVGDQTADLENLRHRYGNFHCAVFKERSTESLTEFLADEFKRHLLRHEVPRVLESKRLAGASNRRLPRRMSVAWICSHFEFSTKRIESWNRYRSEERLDLSANDLRLFVVEAEILSRLSAANSDVVTERQAAAMAGIPIVVLRGLRDAGRLGSGAKGQKRFRRSAIKRFLRELQTVGEEMSEQALDKSQHISLARALEITTFWSKDGKTRFFLDMLDGKVSTAGRTGASNQQLYFDRNVLKQYIERERQSVSEQGLTRSAAAKKLQCSSCYVVELLKMGHLLEVSGPYYREVCRISLRQFDKRYVSLNALTSQLDTTVPNLRRKAEQQKRKLLLVTNKRGVISAFVRRTDARALLKTIEKERSEAVARSIAWRERVAKEEKLVVYLESLRQDNLPLPRHGRYPNLKEIARLSGIHRNDFYCGKGLQQIVREYVVEDAAVHGYDRRDDIQKIDDYLQELRSTGAELPVQRNGRPHKFDIAQASGADRKVFYKSDEANQRIAEFIAERAVAPSSNHGEIR